MIFCSVVMVVSSNAPRPGASPPRPLRAPPRLAIRRGDVSVEGFFDMHIHSSPAPFQRIGDSVDIARWCAAGGLAGIVIKSHFESTMSKAHHARREVVKEFPDFKVFAGIALSRGVGGLNPGAVEIALDQGARVVWLPTFDSANHARVFGAAGTY